MNWYWLFGDIERFHAAREKQFSRKSKNMCLAPFSSSAGPNGPTERAQIKYCLMEIDITVDGSGHILRTTRWYCAVAWAKGHRSYRFGWRGPRFWMDPNTIFYLATERTAMNSLVPFLLVPQGRIGLRHALRHSVSADWNLKSGLLLLVYKG